MSTVSSLAAVIWENLSQTYKRLCIANYFFDSSFPSRCQSVFLLSVNFKPLRHLSTCSYPTQTATHSFSASICTIYRRRATESPSDIAVTSHCLCHMTGGWEEVNGDGTAERSTTRLYPHMASRPPTVIAMVTALLTFLEYLLCAATILSRSALYIHIYSHTQDSQ